MNNLSPRPKIKIEESKLVKQHQRLAFFLLVIHLILVGATYSMLPTHIPSHFNFLGQVDGQGPKVLIWTLPFLSMGIYFLMRLVGRFPETHNYRVKISEENAVEQYTKSMELGAYINMLTTALLLLLSIIVILSSFNSNRNFGTILVLAVVLYLILILKRSFSK